MTGNLFSTIRDAAPDPDRGAGRAARRIQHHLRRRVRAGGAVRQRAGGRRRRARRPRGRSGREVVAGRRALPRLPAGGRRLPSAEPRVHRGRGGALPAGRRAAGARLRSRAVRRLVGAGAGPRGGAPGDDGIRRWRLAPRPRARAAGRADRRRPGRLGPGGHPLHVGDDRPLQRRHAHPRQPALERAGAGGVLAVHGRRRARARPAHLPHARPVRGHQRGAAVRWVDDLPARLRRCGRARRARSGHRAHGRADLLHPSPPAPGADPGRPCPGCACSCRGRRPCWPRPTRRGRSGPVTPSSSATA